MKRSGLRIGVDTRALAFPRNGNARYLFQTLLELIPLRRDDTFIFFTHRRPHSDYETLLQLPNVELSVSRLPLPGPFWIHAHLPGRIRQTKCDIFWGTIAMLPLRSRQRLGIPCIVNFHDLNPFVAPETMSTWVRWQQRLLNPHTLNQADAVLCLSRTTLEDISVFVPSVADGRLHVVYPGCDVPKVKAVRPKGPVGKLRGFALIVGTIEPRKNQLTLINAQIDARKKQPKVIPLVIVGRQGWGDSALYNRLVSGELEDFGIHYLEEADESALRWCYESCSYVICPSLHEGFGLPILEAHLFRKATLLSDIRVFREVGAGSSFVAPLDQAAWTSALILFDAQAKKKALSAPKFDKKYWSYERTAAQISTIINSVLPAPEK